MHDPSDWQAWLAYIDNLSVEVNQQAEKIDLSLVRVKLLAEQLGVLKQTFFNITVTGTNGKGSVCRVLEQVLLAHGYAVSVFSSPYICDFREQLRINNQQLSQQEYIQAFALVQQAMQHSKQLAITPFEFTFLAILVLIQQQQPQIAIFEVGMGGATDVTNILDNDIAVLTNVSLDHTNYLGQDREAIGLVKAGIFRTGKIAVIADDNPPTTVLAMAKQLNTTIFQINQDWGFKFNADQTWDWYSQQQQYTELPKGKLQTENIATALAVLEQIPYQFDLKFIKQVIATTDLTGRYQILSSKDLAKYTIFQNYSQLPTVILDAAHNPAAAELLASKLISLQQQQKKIIACFGLLKDKDLVGVIQPLLNIIQTWYLVDIDGSRGQTAQQLSAKIRHQFSKHKINLVPAGEMLNTLNLIQQQQIIDKDTVIVVFGSFNMLRMFLQLLNYK